MNGRSGVKRRLASDTQKPEWPMPFYFLKRYHAVDPTRDRTWHSGRESALEDPGLSEAVAMAHSHIEDLQQHGGLIVLFDDQGTRIWHAALDAAIAVPLQAVAE